MIHAKLFVPMPRLAFVPCLLAAILVLGWAGEAKGQQKKNVHVTLDPLFVHEDGGAQDITVEAVVEDDKAADEDIQIAMGIPAASASAQYLNDLFRVSFPSSLVIKAGAKKATGTITITPIPNDRIGPTPESTKESLDLDRNDFWSTPETEKAVAQTLLRGLPNILVPIRFTPGNANIIYRPQQRYVTESGGGEGGNNLKYLYVEILDDDQYPQAINLSFKPSKLSKQADVTSIEVTGTLDGGALTSKKLEPQLVVVSGAADTLTRDVDYSLRGLGKLTIPKRKIEGTTTFTLDPNNKAGKIVVGARDTLLKGEVIKKRMYNGKQVRVDINCDGTWDKDDFVIPAGARSSVKETNTGEGKRDLYICFDLNGDGDLSFNKGAALSYTLGSTGVLDRIDSVPVSGPALVESELGVDFTNASRDAGSLSWDGDYLDSYMPTGNAISEVGLRRVNLFDWVGRIDLNGDGDFDDTFGVGDTIKYVESFILPDIKVNRGTITVEDVAVAEIKDFTLSPKMIREAAGATDIAMTVELKKALTGAKAVDFQILTNSTGTRDVHYEVEVTEGLTIPAGDTKGAATLRVTPVDNSGVNGDRTFEVIAKVGTEASQMDTVEFKITDDETLSDDITLSVNPSEIKKDAGATTVTVTGTLDGKVLDAAATITLVVDRTPDKKATRDIEYTAVLGSLTIPRGEITGSTTITITPINDGKPANDKTITIKQLTDNLKNQDDDKITVGTATITLKDAAMMDDSGSSDTTADTGRPSFGAAALAFEATVGQAFSTVLPAAMGGQGTLMYSVSATLPMGLSFDAATRTISGTPTLAGMATVVYMVLDSDGDSGAKTFTITVGEAASATVGVASVMASQSAVRENGDTAEIRVTATLSGAAPAAETVRFTIVPPTSGAAATRDVDYTATLAGTITIAAGETMGWTTLFLSPIDNASADGHKHLGIRAAASGGWGQVDLRISDDETPSTSLVLSVTPSALSESAELTEVMIMAALDGKPLAENATVSVSIDEASSAARDLDYSALFNPTITIAAGSIMGSTRLLIDPVSDGMAEGDETVVLNAMLPGLTAGSATLVLTDTDSGMMDDNDGDREMMIPLSFVEGTSIDAHAYTAGTAITPLVLPVALGGEGSITYSVSGLPAGLSFDAATRTISGTPEAATDGAVEVTYTAMAGAESVSLMFAITINAMLDFGDLSSLFGLNSGAGKANPADSHTDNMIQFTVGVPANLTLPAVSGGTPPLTYSVSGLPAGLSFDAATRTISGTPTTMGETVATYTVMDASGASQSLPLSMAVVEPPLSAPTNLVAEDYKGADGQGDQGGFVMLSWELSADHKSLDGYRIFRALPVLENEMVPWARVDAVPGVAMGRAIVATLDNVSTRWGIAAERGGRTTHHAAKAVFVEADDLTAPYAQMAATLQASRAAAQEGPVLASLLPEALAYARGVAPKLNVVSSVLSSSITWTAEAVRATDDIAPLAVSALQVLDAPDDQGGRIALTWTLSPSDQVLQGVVAGALGPAPVEPVVGVHGYRIYRRAVGEEAFSVVAEVASGVASFVDETAQHGVHYTYQVRPFDWDNETDSVEHTALAVRNRVADSQGQALLGLFGADARIGFDDFFVLADRFGLTAGDAGFDPAFDLAPNGTIDFDDFFVLADHFGRSMAVAGKPVPLLAGLNAEARLYLDAPTALPSVGEEFVVNVRLADFVAVKGYGLQVAYDADQLTFVEVRTDQPLGGSAFATPQVLADQAGVLTVAAHGDVVSDGELMLRLVFRPTTEIEHTTLEITDSQTYDRALGFNRLALPAPVSVQTRPAVFSLAANYPNPFNPQTTIQYALPQAADVGLTVYNVLGQPVRTLVAEHQAAGRYAVEWDATNDSGQSVSSGMYFYRLQAGGDFLDIKKMLLLK